MNGPKFEGVTALAIANVYFDGKVVSHALLLPGGVKKTLGIIYPGRFEFSTGVPETMEVTSGSCRVKLQGESEYVSYEAGQSFGVPGGSSFEIVVTEGLLQYVCSYG